MAIQVMRHLEDLPLLAELEEPTWGTRASEVEALFARPDKGLMRTPDGSIAAFTNADVGALRAHPAVSHHDLDAIMASYPPGMDGFRRLLAPSTFVVSGAEHAPVKQMVSHMMSPRAAGMLREAYSQAVRERLLGIVNQGDIQFGRDVAAPLVADFWRLAVGLPSEYVPDLIEWTSDITFLFRAGVTPEQLEAGDQASAKMLATLPALLRENAQTGESPFLSALVQHISSNGAQVQDPYGALALALIDGFNTLKVVQNACVHALLQARIQPGDHHGDESFAPNAFMETVRLYSPVANLARYVIQDFVYDGVAVPARTNLYMLWMVASRDPSVFENPNEFKLERDQRNKQLVFGGGTYICAGRNVVRVVCETLMAEMAAARIRLESAGEPTLIRDNVGFEVSEVAVALIAQ